MNLMNIFRRRTADSSVGRYTYHFHIRAAVLDGTLAGVMLMNAYVARKALGASDVLIMLLTMIPMTSFLLSAVFSSMMAGRDKRRIFLLAGVFGRIVLAGVFFVNSPGWFIAVITFSTFFTSILIPAQNALFQSNYTNLERGRVFGTASAAGALMTIAAAYGVGGLLEWKEGFYHCIYPAAGIIGFGACYYYFRVRIRKQAALAAEVFRPKSPGIKERLIHPFVSSWKILMENRDFFRFERNFFLYGIAFMMIQPVLPIYLVDEIQIDYRQAARAQGVIFQLMIILFAPLMGKLCDRINPVRLSAVIFLILGFFPLIMAYSTDITGIYGAFVIYGLGMAGVHIVWNLGPMFFAGEKDAVSFMGVHATLVGVRSIFAFPLGERLMNIFSAKTVFILSFTLLCAACILMWKLSTELNDGR